MNFNSPEFLFFFTGVLCTYICVRRFERLRDCFLLFASYLFYMSWDWRFAGLIGFSTIVDYAVGWGIVKYKARPMRRMLLTLSLVSNLGVLGVFKYFNFFTDVLTSSLNVLGNEWSWEGIEFLLPVGISFYTFQTMSYTIDLYRGEIKHESNFIKFALFVSFFPQLVAGPIVRAREFLPQLHRTPLVSRVQFNEGLLLVFRGLFKKVVFADLLAALAVDAVFDDPAAFSSLDLYLGVCGYAFQIYCDFSGYSDVAIGVAAMLGFQLPKNFDRPYMSEGIREFWSRWHISLSTWLRDYLYIPLGGSRFGKLATKRNLLITMLLGGLWHGAAMNFVLWGLYHGFLLVGAHSLKATLPVVKYRLARKMVCFHLVLFGWLLFRCDTYECFSTYLTGLGQLTLGLGLSSAFYLVLIAAASSHWLMSSDWLARASMRVSLFPAPVLGAGVAFLLLLFWGCSLNTPNFIYFQF